MDRGKKFSAGLTGADFAAGLAHHRAGRALEAISCYAMSLAASPDHPRILGLLGQAEIAAGEIAAGLRDLERAMELAPGHDETCFAYANGCAQAGRHDDAIKQYRALLARMPAHLGAALNLIALLRSRNEPAAMRDTALHALAHHIEQPRLLLALAVAALQERDAGSALPLLDRALHHEPELAEAHFLRGTALNMVGRAAEALDAQCCAIALDPGHAAAHLNLGNVLTDLDRPQEALEYCRQALAIDPDLIEAHVSLGYIFTRLGRLDDAIAACRQALARSPRHVQAHWNLGIASLLAGDWSEGWRQYEWRKRPELYAAHFRIPRGEEWNGGDLAGRCLTVCAEQGLGDAIQLARYLPLLASRGAHLILSCARPLIPLFADLPHLCAVLDRADALPDADLWVDQMSLPGIFGTVPTNIPGAAGYISADPKRVAHWRGLLPQDFKVGLVWCGNPLHSNDRRRSLAPGDLEELLNISGVSLISLQLGPPLPMGWEGRVFNAAAQLLDFAETAACIANLDLLITVDTSAAHLAGAMGKCVWTMLPFAPDWRWLTKRTDTPWYDSMRLFRQSVDGDWKSVVHEIAGRLRSLLAQPRD